MKTVIRSLLAIAILGLAFAARVHAAAPPPGVEVTYAFVPKARLADAIKGRVEALEIETTWRKEMMSQSDLLGYPLNLGNQHYSIVVFVTIPTRFALQGQIGIPVQNPSTSVILNVSLAPGYSGTYVIDGGGLILTKGIPPEPKPYEWREVHIE